MKLKSSEIVWMPREMPEYLAIVPREAPPRNRETLLLAAADLLERLVAESGPEDLADANQLVRGRLPAEWLALLPGRMFKDRNLPNLLLRGPMAENSGLQRWREGIEAALAAPQETPENKAATLAALNLVEHLDGLL